MVRTHLLPVTKRMDSRLAVAAAILLTLTAVGSHDASAAGRFEGGLGFLAGIPSGEFADQIEDSGIGADFEGGWRPANTPFVIGARVGVLTYGNTSRKEPFNPNIPEVNVRVETSNNIVLGHAFLRLIPPGGVFRPFVEGFLGLSYLYTDSRVENDRDDQEIASSTNFDDTVFSLGAGGGVLVRVWSARDTEQLKKGPRAFFVNAKGQYIAGGEGRYLKEGSLHSENGRLVFNVQQSKTSLIGITVGASMEF